MDLHGDVLSEIDAELTTLGPVEETLLEGGELDVDAAGRHDDSSAEARTRVGAVR